MSNIKFPRKNNPIVFLTIVFICALTISIAVFFHKRQFLDKDNFAKEQKIQQMYLEYKRSYFSSVADISAEEVLKLDDEQIVLVDLRSSREQKISMIAGAITKEEFEKNINKYKMKKIILYCTIGNRSGQYALKLKEKGIKVHNLIGSILSWVHAGGEVVDSQGKTTNRVHVYGPKWDLLPEGYERLW